MDKLLAFLKNQKVLAIASYDDRDIWMVNVYFATDDNGTLYFISSENSRHAKMILGNPNISFSVSWFDRSDLENRKGVQGAGVCQVVEGEENIEKALQLYNKYFPEFKGENTIDWIRNNTEGYKLWVIKPSHIKYWDDEVYGENESEDFNMI